jgi:uncharacterized protein (DUF2141 family)
MFKLMAGAAVALVAFAAQPGAAQAALGPHAAACRSNANGPAVLVTVYGFKQRTGNVRVQLYRANSEFLEKGRWLERIDLPVTGSGPMRICVPAPGAGRYAIAVRHDVDGNGRSTWNDGGGFSRNPRMSLTNLRPRPQDVAIDLNGGVENINVILNYRFGLSIRPVAG